MVRFGIILGLTSYYTSMVEWFEIYEMYESNSVYVCIKIFIMLIV